MNEFKDRVYKLCVDTIKDIDLNKMYVDVIDKLVVDKYNLILYLESLYYILTLDNDRSDDVGFLSHSLGLLRDDSTETSQISYCYLIYMCDHIEKKTRSNLNIYM